MAAKKKILFFINGSQPTKEQAAAAEQIGASFRNTRFVGESDSVEAADAYTGDVPEIYLKRFPKTEVIKLEIKPVEPVKPVAPAKK